MEKNLRCALCKDHVINSFIFDCWQDNLHPLAGSDHSKVSFLWKISVLNYLIPNFFQHFETPKSIYFLKCNYITCSGRQKKLLVNIVPIDGFGFENFKKWGSYRQYNPEFRFIFFECGFGRIIIEQRLFLARHSCDLFQ